MAMECPQCFCKHCPVNHTREMTYPTVNAQGQRVRVRINRRERTCRNCGEQFITTEMANYRNSPGLADTPADASDIL